MHALRKCCSSNKVGCCPSEKLGSELIFKRILGYLKYIDIEIEQKCPIEAVVLTLYYTTPPLDLSHVHHIAVNHPLV